jgi:hypothetical protein
MILDTVRLAQGRSLMVYVTNTHPVDDQDHVCKMARE